MMDEARFWSIIESTRQAAKRIPRKPTTDFIDVHEQTLREALSQIQMLYVQVADQSPAG